MKIISRKLASQLSHRRALYLESGIFGRHHGVTFICYIDACHVPQCKTIGWTLPDHCGEPDRAKRCVADFLSRLTAAGIDWEPSIRQTRVAAE